MSGRREPLLYLNDMVDAAKRAVAHADGVDDAYLIEDPMRRDAILYALLVLGEAAKAVPKATRTSHPEIPWAALAAVRDVVAHRYFGIDAEEVRRIVREDIPRDLSAIEAARDEALGDWRARHPDAVE